MSNGIDYSFLTRLKEFLFKCDVFNAQDTLDNLFVDSRINLWAGQYKQCDSKQHRIDSIIVFLHDRKNDENRNALALFLRTLANYYNPEDDNHKKSLCFAEELESVLSQQANSDYLPSHKHQETKISKHNADISLSCHNITRLVNIVQDEITPLLEELGQSSIAQTLNDKSVELAMLNSKSDITPVALIGFTGSGKTSLTNAILDQILGTAGGGETQSASALIASYNPEYYKVAVSYIGLDDLLEFLNKIHFDTRSKDLSKRPDERYLTDSYRIFLSATLKDYEMSLENEMIHPKDLKQDIAKRVKKRTQTRIFSGDEHEALAAYVRDLTNSKGQYWTITQEVRVAGPFNGLISKGANIVLMDLPGLGDLNEIRIKRTHEALANANQVLIVVGQRGINSNIKEALAESQIISRLLSHPNIRQITFVGTKLDDITAVSDDELADLGLSPDASPNVIISAKFDSWRRLVKKQWTDMLIRWSSNTQVQKHGHYNTVEAIVAHSDYVPCSPPAYLALRKFIPDRMEVFARSFAQEADNKKLSLTSTGIPKIRESIHKIAQEQYMLRQLHLSDKGDDLRKTTLSHCDSLLESILQELQYSEATRKQYLMLEESIKELKSYARKFNAQPACNAAAQEMQQLIIIFEKGWEDLNQKMLKDLLNKELGDLHFMTFKATLVRQGVFQSSGKSQRYINLPNDIGAYVIGPCASYINRTVLRIFLQNSQTLVEEDAGYLRRSIEDIVSSSMQEIESKDVYDTLKQGHLAEK